MTARFGNVLCGVALLAATGLAGFSTALAGTPAGMPGATNLLTLANRTVSGVVQDDAGRPAANVNVRLLKGSMKSSGPMEIPPGGSPTGDAVIGAPGHTELQTGNAKQGRNEKVVKEMKSDASGKFVFTDIAPGKYALLAGDGKPASRMAIVVTDSEFPPVTVKLGKP